MDIAPYSRLKKMSPQLLVSDIDSSIEFYIKTLCFAIEFRHEDLYAGIIKDGFSIHLTSGEPSVEERKNKRNNEDLDIVFSVEGIEYLYQELANKSIEFIQPLRDVSYGKEFYIADPDGYIIAFLSAS